MRHSINLKKSLLDLDETPVDGVTMSDLLARSLVSSSEGDPIKYLDWALDLKRHGKLETDSADLDRVQAHVNQAKDMTILAKGQILKEIKAQRELATQNK